MNTNYYLNELSEKMSNLEEKVNLLEEKLEALAKVNGHQSEVLTKIRPFDKSERNRAKEKAKENKLAHGVVQPQDLNQMWYDGDGGELYE